MTQLHIIATSAYASNKKALQSRGGFITVISETHFSRIIRITRLREVKVLLGFTRVDAPILMQIINLMLFISVAQE